MSGISIIPFAQDHTATVQEVGGKGLSLICMTQAGLPVPDGFVLPVSFFASWMEDIKSTPVWSEFIIACQSNWPSCCALLKAQCQSLLLTKEQSSSLAAGLAKYPLDTFFAVRSSSPEEDLEGSSFAGGYVTVLGVTQSKLEEAIRVAFSSCFDHRVVVYKQKHGFDVTDPKIAIVIQTQIASDVAGVGFSLNPVTNYYDEVIINANWGLGESVVSGVVTPDSFVVDKVNKKITKSNLGSKETSIWLKPTGSTEERASLQKNDLSLTVDQVIELTNAIITTERLYRKPIDIEWAYAGNRLYLLQARPITSYVPLSPKMLTQPGAKRRLYLDATISVQGIYEPLSVMGTSILAIVLSQMSEIIFGRDITLDIETTIPWVENGRLYLNVSSALSLIGKDKLVAAFTNMDPLTAGCIANLDESSYRSDNHKLKSLPLDILWNVPDSLLHLLEARLLPKQAHERSQKKFRDFITKARVMAEQSIPLGDFTRHLLKLTSVLVFKYSMPLFFTSRIALSKIRTLFDPQLRDQLNKLDRSLPNNVTIEMGLELYRLATLLPKGITFEELESGLSSSSLPPAFLSAWQHFLSLYGHRGPSEIDIASPRYREQPQMLLEQLVQQRNATNQAESPQQRFDRQRHERQIAYEALSTKIHSRGWLQTKRLQSLFHVLETIGGYRETHKYYLVFAIDLLRQRILKEAQLLVNAGRIDSPEKIFDLTFADLEQALLDCTLDLEELAAGNRLFANKLARIHQLPTLIDSRGLIFRPLTKGTEGGAVVGTAVSAGIVRGPVKVLHGPNEKPLCPGDVLVARATDPGWTPLFVNAAAVVLEVGGLLQHGALVAREYGIPCVTGVLNATTQWEDGTIVEVDGSSGTIRHIASN